MMADPEVYNFQLKNLERTMNENWKEIQSKSEFHDVTLACDENQLSAHKVVLASSSPVLQKLLSRTYHQHPLICLPGVSYPVLTSIMEFIYEGEVGINQDMMKDFFSAANDLKIRGLSEDERQEAISVNISHPDFFDNYSDITIPTEYNQDVVDQRESLKNNYNKQNMVEKKGHIFTPFDSNKKQILQTKFVEHTTTDMKKVEYESLLSNEEGKDFLLNCKSCDYKATHRKNMSKHVKSKHVRRHYSCNECNHKSSDKSNLKRHIAIQHEGKRYSCDICERSFAPKYRLFEHIKTKHEGFRYHCPLCSSNYTDRQSLRIHLASLHKNEKNVENYGKKFTYYSCNHCKFRCADKMTLQKHFVSIHEVNNSQEVIKDLHAIVSDLKNEDGIHEDLSESNSDNFDAISTNSGQVDYTKDIFIPIQNSKADDNYESLKNKQKTNNEIKQVQKLDKKNYHTLIPFDNKEKQISVTKFAEQIITKVKKAEYEDISKKEDFLYFLCDECSYKSTHKGGMTKHVNSKHLGVMYSCDQCSYSSNNTPNLKRHVVSQHDKIRHFCDTCEKSFTQKYRLLEHQKSKH